MSGTSAILDVGPTAQAYSQFAPYTAAPGIGTAIGASTGLTWTGPHYPQAELLPGVEPSPKWFFSLRRDSFLAIEMGDGRFSVYKKKPLLPLYIRLHNGLSLGTATEVIGKYKKTFQVKQVYSLEDLHAARALDELTKE